MALTGAPAAPVPPRPATPHGIVLFTWYTSQVLFLNEDGRIVRRYDVGKLAGKGWWPVAVSPDGTRLAVVETPASANDSTTYRLRIIPLVGDARPIDLPRATPADGSFIWSGDRKSLVGSRSLISLLDSHTRNINIDLESGDWYDLPLVARPDTDKQYPVTKHAVMDWSPDGKWFLTGVRTGTYARRLFVTSRDGTVCYPLTDEQSRVGFARISPDGTTVLFSRIDPSSRRHVRGSTGDAYGLYTVKVAGGEPVRIARIEAPVCGPYLMRFAWRPDGKRIMYGLLTADLLDAHPGPARFVTCDPDGRNAKVLKISPELGGFIIHGWR